MSTQPRTHAPIAVPPALATVMVSRAPAPRPTAAPRTRRPLAGRPAAVVVSDRPDWRHVVAAACERVGIVCAFADLDCLRTLTADIADERVLIIDADAPGLDACMDALRDRGVQSRIVLAETRESARAAMGAMRAGAGDVVSRGGRSAAALGARIMAASDRSWTLAARAQRVVDLERLCRRLGTSREALARQAHRRSSDAQAALQELAEHMNNVSTAAEFRGLIRGELDIESLLRTTLEFVLARSGPTNAAIFLPSSSGDYSLGAYVNYDCPKETCDVLLDHLANAVAPKFERSIGMVNLTTPEQLGEYIDGEADWLAGSCVAGFACRHENEPLAIFMLFRDRRSPFTPQLLEQVKTVGELFAAQLARVIHIHHRHLPKDKWGMMGDPEKREDDYGDLAA